MKILIADDFQPMRRRIIELLREAYPEAQIAEAGTGNEALCKMQGSSWNLVLMDVNMPGNTGMETLKKAKEISVETPVLVLSLNNEQLYAVRALKSGASGFLAKENSADELVNAVKEILSGNKYFNKK